jgi:hypothetical protein
MAFAHGYSQTPNTVASGGGLRTALGQAEEGGALLRVVAELMTQEAERAGGVAEAAGDLGRGFLIDQVRTESFVLALQGELRGEEEVLAGIVN